MSSLDYGRKLIVVSGHGLCGKDTSAEIATWSDRHVAQCLIFESILESDLVLRRCPLS